MTAVSASGPCWASQEAGSSPLGQVDDRGLAPVLGDARGEQRGGALSGLVAVERDHRRAGVHRQDLLDLAGAERQPGGTDRLEAVTETRGPGRGGDRERVERSFDDHHLPVLDQLHPLGGVQRRALVVHGRAGRVEVLGRHPALVAERRAAEQPDDRPLVVFDGQHEAMLEGVGDRLVVPPAGEAGVDELVVGEPALAEMGHQLVRVVGGVAGDVAELADVDPAVCEVGGGLLRQPRQRVVAPGGGQRRADSLGRGALEVGLLDAVLLAHLAAQRRDSAAGRVRESAAVGVEHRQGGARVDTVDVPNPLDHVAGGAAPEAVVAALVEVQQHRRGAVVVPRHRAGDEHVAAAVSQRVARACGHRRERVPRRARRRSRRS